MRDAQAFVLLAAGAIAVLAVSSYATADSGKKEVGTGPLSGYLEGDGPSLDRRDRVVRRDDRRRRRGDRHALLLGPRGRHQAGAHPLRSAQRQRGHLGVALRDRDEPVPDASTPTCPQSGTVTGTITALEVIGPAGQGIARGRVRRARRRAPGGTGRTRTSTRRSSRAARSAVRSTTTTSGTTSLD